MKKMIKTIGMAMLSAMLFSSAAFAFEDSVKVNDSNSFNLVINNIQSNTHLTLIDKHNNILFEQSLDSAKTFAKTFNLELLPKGEYRILIEDNTRTKIMPLSLVEAGIQIDGDKTKWHYKPVVNERGSRVYITQFSPQSDPLRVAIYNRFKELMYEDVLSDKMDLGKVYDFSQSYPGQYIIYLESNGIESKHLVTIEK